jgi:hypothetical protein
MIGIHAGDGRFKLSAYERDSIYQGSDFPNLAARRGILKEFRDERVFDRAMKWFRARAAMIRWASWYWTNL